MNRRIARSSFSFLLSLMMFLTIPVMTGSGMRFLPSEAYAAEEVAAVHTSYNGKSPYYIMVNRQMNTVTVYGVGDDGNYSVPVKAMIASCGRAGHATPLGTFSTPDSRYTWRLMVDGTYGQYASRIHGSILFHSICYTSANKNRMISSEYDALGGLASRGCVRLQTIDAKWIYDNCPTGTLVTIYDSPEAGVLGKPQKAVSSVSSSPNKNWDPTDPDPANPWLLEVSWAVSGTGHGEVVGTGAYRYGENVTLTAVPDAGSVFECWYDENWNYLSSDPVYSITVDREQRLTASFRSQVNVGVHASASGTCSESMAVDPGTQVTVTTAPAVGESGIPAAFLGWYDGSGNQLSTDVEYTFTVNESLELYAMYDGDSYGDIPAGAWYAKEAAAAKKAGITNGMTPVLFGADQPFTRAMTVQMIARSAGADLTTPEQSSFSDVPVDSWFAAAVEWAGKNGIVRGISETEFAPDQEISRQDMLVMMGRYMESVENNLKKTEDVPSEPSVLETPDPVLPAVNPRDQLTFADTGDIADYAVSWILYARDHGLLKGYEDNTVRPLTILSRAEGTVFIMRMMECLQKLSS